jgi:hypothetical protein
MITLERKIELLRDTISPDGLYKYLPVYPWSNRIQYRMKQCFTKKEISWVSSIMWRGNVNDGMIESNIKENLHNELNTLIIKLRDQKIKQLGL